MDVVLTVSIWIDRIKALHLQVGRDDRWPMCDTFWCDDAKTGPLQGWSTGHRGIPSQKGSNKELYLLLAWTNYWTKRRVAGDLARHAAYVT